jgi:hypothetical protein
MKKQLAVRFDEEKQEALLLYASQKGVDVEAELTKTMEALYQKYVPLNVKGFIKLKAKGQVQQKRTQKNDSSAVLPAISGDGV